MANQDGYPILRSLGVGLLLLAGIATPSFAGEGASRDEGDPLRIERISMEEIRTLVQRPSERIRLFNVWATWCPPCVDEFPELLAIQSDFREHLELIAISANTPEEEEDVRAFLERQGASGRNLLFDNDDLHSMVKALDRRWKEILPHTVLVDRTGRIRFRREGRIDEAKLRSEIAKLVDRERSAAR